MRVMQDSNSVKIAKRRSVAVLFGGRSVEHEISVITALQLIEAIDQDRYEVIPVYISPKGIWYTGDALLNRSIYSKPQEIELVAQEVTLLPKPGIGGLTVLSSQRSILGDQGQGIERGFIPIDVFFLAFHGEFGEDGCIQGLCELADVAYTGSGVTALAVSMDKYLCKMVAHATNVPVLPALRISREVAQRDIGKVCTEIVQTENFTVFPLFVKPCNLGSSIGISKVNSFQELPRALAKALRYDKSVLIEPCVSNIMEINVSVREHPEHGAEASVVEIPVTSTGVLSYEEKYLRDGGKKTGPSSGMASLTRIIDPQDLDVRIKQNVTQYALQLFKLLGCSGVARLDFIVDLATGKLYFNELNAFPGSVSFYLWVKSHPKVLFTDLLADMIEVALIQKSKKDSLDHNVGLKALK
jgi:D-alanine-D-alanine ligase